MATIDQIAVMDAVATMAIAGAASNLFAFYRPFVRISHGDSQFGDLLAGGIWVRALGTVFAATAVIAHHRFGMNGFWLYMIGWSLSVVAYYMHFLAWRGARFGRERLFALATAGLLVVIGVAGFGVYFFLLH